MQPIPFREAQCTLYALGEKRCPTILAALVAWKPLEEGAFVGGIELGRVCVRPQRPCHILRLHRPRDDMASQIHRTAARLQAQIKYAECILWKNSSAQRYFY